jgi:ribonucleoside-diphosphate reductase alpha chain
VSGVLVRNLNRIIDINFYPTPETERSNMRHRPIGLGVQGLADVFAMMGLSWEDEAAAELNQRIFENIYFAAVDMSCDVAREEGAYETFGAHVNPYSSVGHDRREQNEGSPASYGKLQPDLWGVTPITENTKELDWSALREKAKGGMRNSLLLAPMPTASTSQILGYNECFEPFTSNIYTRRTLAGEYIIVNKHLMRELLELGIWSDDMKQQILARNGSVQGIPGIPESIQLRYKTAWELKQRILIDMAAARGAFICQSQSLNLFVADANYAKLTSMHFHAWKKGLKTGCYYLRTKAPVAAQKFTIDPRLMAAVSGGAMPTQEKEEEDDVRQSDDEDDFSSDSESEDEKPSAAELAKRKREELKARLAAEYEEEARRAREAAEKGEGCLFCSA